MKLYYYYLKVLTIFIFILLSSTSINARTILKEETELQCSNTINGDVEYYAVLIGISEFEDIDTLPEDKLDDDAIIMHETLINSKNWKEENILLLTNEEGTKEAIRNSIIEWLDSREDENDVVLYYFSGHSIKMPLKNKKFGNTYSFPYDISDTNFSEDKITDKELDSWIDELESDNICLIFDSCYSGKMRHLVQKGRIILAAGGKHFFCGVDESDALGYGIFTFFVMQGLKGVADLNKDGWITAEECFRYARIPTIISSFYVQFPFLQEWNGQTIFWTFQVPTMYDRYLGNFPILEYKISE